MDSSNHRHLILGAATWLLFGACGEPASGDPTGADEGSSTGDATSTMTTTTPEPTTTSAPSTTDTPTGEDSTDDGDDTTGEPVDYDVVPLRVNAFNVPTVGTYYACFEFTFTLDQLGHIVGFRPFIDDMQHVHHYVLSKLDGPSGQGDGYSCFDLSGEMIYTWAPGGEGWDLPEEAGFLIGDGPEGAVTLRLQVHYNNPNGDVGATDSSGLDLHVSRTLRPNNAGSMVFGDIDSIEIPAATPDHNHIATCSANATTNLLAEPMNIFGTAMHAHELGRVLWTEVWRDGSMLYELNRDDPYLFDSQHMKLVDQVINPGDEVQTHCIYDSSDRTQTTYGGPGTADEMCWNVVAYWPRVPNPVDLCGTGS